MRSLTAKNVSTKFKNKFSESRVRNNYMSASNIDRNYSEIKSRYYNGSDSGIERSGGKKEKKLYNTYQINFA